MKKSTTVVKYKDQLIELRSYLQIDFIYFLESNSKTKRILIKPYDTINELNNHFLQILEDYKSCLDKLIKSKLDVIELQKILLNEILIFEDINTLQGPEDVISYFNPIFYDMDASGNIKPPSKIHQKFTLKEKKYIWDNFKVRKIYCKQILSLLNTKFIDLNNMLQTRKIQNIPKNPQLEKIISEFWYLLEISMFKKSLNEKELSLLRHQLFTSLGTNDVKYSKYKSDILSRKENNRFSDLSKLINKGTVNITNIDSRSVHRLRKSKLKSK